MLPALSMAMLPVQKCSVLFLMLPDWNSVGLEGVRNSYHPHGGSCRYAYGMGRDERLMIAEFPIGKAVHCEARERIQFGGCALLRTWPVAAEACIGYASRITQCRIVRIFASFNMHSPEIDLVRAGVYSVKQFAFTGWWKHRSVEILRQHAILAAD